MEGALDGKFSEVNTLAQKFGGNKQITVLASTSDQIREIQGTFSSVNVMLHGDSQPVVTSYSDSFFINMIKPWLDKIDHHKLVLGMTTAGLTADTLDFFKQVVTDNGLRGLSFWKVKDWPSGLPISCVTGGSCRGVTANATHV